MAPVERAAAIEVEGLRKAYDGREAVRGIDFEVRRGEVFGLLGPNGAGKTTTVEILEGHRVRTAGSVSVLGHDPGARPAALRERVGVVLQSCGTYPQNMAFCHAWAVPVLPATGRSSCAAVPVPRSTASTSTSVTWSAT